MLKKAEGGRHTPFVTNYAPQLFTRTANVTAVVELPEVQCDMFGLPIIICLVF